jgi:hypothetical protein
MVEGSRRGRRLSRGRRRRPAGAHAAHNPLEAIGGLSTFAFLLLTVVALFLVRGRLAAGADGLAQRAVR